MMIYEFPLKNFWMSIEELVLIKVDQDLIDNWLKCLNQGINLLVLEILIKLKNTLGLF